MQKHNAMLTPLILIIAGTILFGRIKREAVNDTKVRMAA
jgi:hypothetical protein